MQVKFLYNINTCTQEQADGNIEGVNDTNQCCIIEEN